jgi:hypothetical protein
MKGRTLSRNCLKMILLCAFVSATPYIASAKPKGNVGGSCSCLCVAPSGIGGNFVKQVTYNSQGYTCGAFEGATCNLDNPYTGGVATGSLIGCENSRSSTSATMFVSPFTGAKVVARSARIQRRLPPLQKPNSAK